MPIPVTCQCGGRFAAKDDLAGKTLNCPKCLRPLTIPRPVQARAATPQRVSNAPQPVAQANPVTNVVVKCRCGQRFQAESFLFGKTVNCPACKSQLTVPVPTAKAQTQTPRSVPGLRPLPKAVPGLQPLAPLDPLAGGFGAAPLDPHSGGFGAAALDPFGGGFGAPLDNDPLGLGLANAAPVTFPAAPLPNYTNYAAPAVAKPVAAKKKKVLGKSGKKWAVTGGGIAAAFVAVFVVLGVLGRVARIVRTTGLPNFAMFSNVKVEWMPHVASNDGYSVEIVKQAPGVTIPGLPPAIGRGGVVSACSRQGPCTVVKVERLPMALSDAQATAALSQFENMLSSTLSSNKGRLTSSSQCSVGGLTGRQVVFEATEGLTTTINQMQVAFYKDRAYILGFIATKNVFKQADADRFFSSFRLLHGGTAAVSGLKRVEVAHHSERVNKLRLASYQMFGCHGRPPPLAF